MPVSLLSVRRDKEGGPLLPKVKEQGFELLSSRLILLIHGYNNTESEAIDSYTEFVKNSGLRGVSVVGQSCGFLWPGDKQWGPLSALSYPFELVPAEESAARLHEYLLEQTVPGNWPLEIILICHSLGNRVGFELLDQYFKAGLPHKLVYRGGCFMAAAVPVAMVDEGGELNAAAHSVINSEVLYSKNDRVLHFAFPLGETIAGEGFLPRAVGRYGDPDAGLWSQRVDMGVFNYNHGDYWKRRESAGAVKKFLGVATEHVIPAMRIEANTLPVKVAEKRRNIASREIEARGFAS